MHAYPPSSWKALFPYLEAWRALSLPQRAAALHVQPVYQHLPAPLLSLPPAIRESLFEPESPKSAARQVVSRSDAPRTGSPRHRPTPGFRKLISLFQRFSTWSGPEGPNLLVFVQQTTTYDQRRALTRVPSGTPTEAMVAAFQRRMVDGAFTRTLLEKEKATGFLDVVNHWTPEEMELTEDRYHILRAWVRGAMRNKRSGFALREDTFRIPGSKVPPEELLVLLTGYGIGFLGLLPESLDPILQIMLPVEKPAQGPEHIEILSHPGAPAFERPFLLDDMDAILRAAREEPIPLLTDGINVPVAKLRRLGKDLLPLPKMLDLAGFEEEYRALAAWWMIGTQELVTASGRGRKSFRAHLNARGEDWLRLPREQKLERVLNEAPMGRRKKHGLGARFSWLGEHVVHPFPYAALNPGVMDALEQAVERLADAGTWSDFDALIRSAALKANPFIADRERDARLDGLWARWEARPETVYAALIHHHLARLASLGAVAFSSDREGVLGVTLAGIGRWLYARSDAWALPPRGQPVAVVGADHHVVFTAADPNLETDLRAFAEPVGETGKTGGPGATFRLTRMSVQEGLHRGLRLDDMLAVLEAGSKTPLPKNVLHEVRSWAGAKRNLSLRETILVECDDPLVLAEVFSAFPKEFERISPTALAHVGHTAHSTRQALAKRLGRKGFFT
jgi:hypothetical protein